MIFLSVAVFAYLAGSVNFAILFFKLTKKDDPRKYYSGNPGATNVYRQAGLAAAAMVLVLDMARAALVAAVSLNFLEPAGVAWAGFFLLVGNRYPCFHQFKGGKGVANYLGFSAVIAPWAAVGSGLAWAAGFAAMRVPFVASFYMVAVLAGATIYKWHHIPAAVTGTAATVLFIVLSHRENLAGWIEKNR